MSNGVAMLNNGPDSDADESDGGDIANAPWEMMKDIRLASGFFSHAGGATPVNANGAVWNNDFVTTTGNIIVDLLHNFHLECGARLHKLRVYETLTDPTGREVCGYLLVRGSEHAHAYGLAQKNLTGVDIEKMLPTPDINLDKIPECQKYLDEGSHRRLYAFSPEDYRDIAGVWTGKALPGDPPGELEVVEGMPEGGKRWRLTGNSRHLSFYQSDGSRRDVGPVQARCGSTCSRRKRVTFDMTQLAEGPGRAADSRGTWARCGDMRYCSTRRHGVPVLNQAHA